MPLKLSGYALSYPQLNKLLESTPLEQASESEDSDAEVLTVWGPIVWFNRWLEKQGMGDKLQAVPVYDPIAAAMAPEGQFHTDRASGTRTPDEHRAQAATGEEAGEPSGVQRSKSKERPTTVEDVDLGEISGQSLLLVRKKKHH
ncbi:hypothetical protein AX16_008400 [Volvariella volvacea WC 439]|nr:hypothetical protein AX16_008400 [Volvariella volvacea WC 439]